MKASLTIMTKDKKQNKVIKGRCEWRCVGGREGSCELVYDIHNTRLTVMFLKSHGYVRFDR